MNNLAGLKIFIQNTLADIEVSLANTMNELETLSSAYSKEIVLFNLLSFVNRVPVLTLQLLFRSVFDPNIFPELNPFAKTRESATIFQKTAILYLELCVLQDKLKRIGILLDSGAANSKIVQELSTTRQWSSLEHPRWLVFEAEGMLQIRNQQYEMARHLIKTQNAISQLNMGLGKTRVILPLIVLHWIDSENQKMITALFISPLIREAHDYMHRYLTASVLAVTIFEQPFNRDIQLDALKVKKLIKSAQMIVNQQGLMILAPEYRLSLALKRLEYENLGITELVALLDRLFVELKGFDIFDEVIYI